jgi:hypothetical protein
VGDLLNRLDESIAVMWFEQRAFHHSVVPWFASRGLCIAPVEMKEFRRPVGFENHQRFMDQSHFVDDGIVFKFSV